MSDSEIVLRKIRYPRNERYPPVRKRGLPCCRRRPAAIFCAVSLRAWAPCFWARWRRNYALPTAKATELSVDGNLRLDFTRDPSSPLSVLPPQFAARAKRIIYLHMAGAPSQLELFDYKPELTKLDGQDCPASFLGRQALCFHQRRAQDVGRRNILFTKREKAASGFPTGCRIWKSTLTIFA